MRSPHCVWLILLAMAGSLWASPARAFEVGGDLSECGWEQATEGVTYQNSRGAAVDPVVFARDHGWKCCRLRLLVDATPGTVLSQDLPYDIAMARRIKAAGMHTILDIFYSDGWCDPGQQPTPPEWADETYPQLAATVKSYTEQVLDSMAAAGVAPRYVQVGNEISNGMLWPVGSLANQTQFIGLVRAGIAGVRASEDPHAKIILQCNNAADTALVEWFYDTIGSQCDYNIVGLSYYPSSGTNLSDISAAMSEYAGRFGGRPIMLVEFAYPWQGAATGAGGYPTTPAGQRACTEALIALMRSFPQGDGVLWWGGTYVTGSWGANSLFDDPDGPIAAALPAWTAFLLAATAQTPGPLPARRL